MKLIKKEIKPNGLPYKKGVKKTPNQGMKSIVHQLPYKFRKLKKMRENG